MSHVEIKTFKFLCDVCGIEEIFQAPQYQRPTNWTAGKVNNPHAMFEYEKDVCPDCSGLQRGKS